MAGSDADDSPPPVVTLRQPGHLEDRQRPQHLLGREPRCDGDLVDRGGAAAGQRLVHPTLGVAQPVERRGGVRFFGRQLTDAADKLNDVVGSGDQLRAVAQQRMTARRADDVTGPGTAATTRPSARAQAAVFAAPLRRPASTTTAAPATAATRRLRVRNRCRAGRTPGGYSVIIVRAQVGPPNCRLAWRTIHETPPRFNSTRWVVASA